MNIEQLLLATDSGNTEEILKCLTNQKPAAATLEGLGAAGTEDLKREDRYDSICKATEEELEARIRLQELGSEANFNA